MPVACLPHGTCSATAVVACVACAESSVICRVIAMFRLLSMLDIGGSLCAVDHSSRALGTTVVPHSSVIDRSARFCRSIAVARLAADPCWWLVSCCRPTPVARLSRGTCSAAFGYCCTVVIVRLLCAGRSSIVRARNPVTRLVLWIDACGSSLARYMLCCCCQLLLCCTDRPSLSCDGEVSTVVCDRCRWPVS